MSSDKAKLIEAKRKALRGAVRGANGKKSVTVKDDVTGWTFRTAPVLRLTEAALKESAAENGAVTQEKVGVEGQEGKTATTTGNHTPGEDAAHAAEVFFAPLETFADDADDADDADGAE